MDIFPMLGIDNCPMLLPLDKLLCRLVYWCKYAPLF